MRGYIGIRMGQCSCSDVEPILWVSDGGTDFLVRLWTACYVQRWRRQWSISWCGERCGVNAGVGVEEALLFEGRSDEGVERYMRMLDEMWKEMRRLTDLVGGGGSGSLETGKRRKN